MNKIPTSALGKALHAVAWCVTHPARTARSLAVGLAQAFRTKVDERSPIQRRSLEDLVGTDTEVTLEDFEGRDGNVSLYELLAITSIVSKRQPRTSLEIGTFDGRTTLQIAKNSPPDARVFTLDLPPDPSEAQARIEKADVAYIEDAGKQVRRKYQRGSAGGKVTQLLGDSATFDFAGALDGRPVEFAFIDGSHSYEYVKSDTERVLALMAPGGIVLWHDYIPAWPGVIEYLGERSRDLPLRRIEGTSIVCLEIPGAAHA